MICTSGDAKEPSSKSLIGNATPVVGGGNARNRSEIIRNIVKTNNNNTSGREGSHKKDRIKAGATNNVAGKDILEIRVGFNGFCHIGGLMDRTSVYVTRGHVFKPHSSSLCFKCNLNSKPLVS